MKLEDLKINCKYCGWVGRLVDTIYPDEELKCPNCNGTDFDIRSEVEVKIKYE